MTANICSMGSPGGSTPEFVNVSGLKVLLGLPTAMLTDRSLTEAGVLREIGNVCDRCVGEIGQAQS